jgi:hypothetical protein
MSVHNVLPVRRLMDEKPAPEPAWLVKKMLPLKAIGVMSAPWGAGKTYVAIDLGLSVATGELFAGRRTQQAGVLYLAAECGDDVHRRAYFAAEHRKLDDPPFLFYGGCPKLTDTNALGILIATAKAKDAEIFAREGVHLGLIIIDTLVVAAAWQDENKSAEVQATGGMTISSAASIRPRTWSPGHKRCCRKPSCCGRCSMSATFRRTRRWGTSNFDLTSKMAYFGSLDFGSTGQT